ncbi:MAG TPA: tetratricopeptide repeat protein, partial [Blastocatellia bacterium]|nr:tetratricopeptide repeat protein [Blastocatellia bacterium]
MRLMLYLIVLPIFLAPPMSLGAKTMEIPQEAARKEGSDPARSAYEEGERLSRQETAESRRQAIAKYEEARQLWRAAGDRRGESRALNQIGDLYSELNDYRRALDHFDQALAIRRADGDRRGEAETLTDAAPNFSLLGDRQKALEYYQRAVALWKEVDDVKGLAVALSGMGTVYSALGEPKQALDYFKQSLPLRRAGNDRRGEATTLNNIGAIHFALGEPQRALEHYDQALPLQREAGNRSGEASTLNNIGAILRIMGESQKALERYQQALSLWRALDDRRGIATTLNNIGALYYRMGDPAQAFNYYDQALPLRREAGDRSGEAITLTSMGAARLALGDPPRAIEHLQQALALVQGGQSRPEEAQALTFLAFASSARGDRQQARGYFGQALELWRAIEERFGEASTLVGMGRLYREQGERQQALALLKQAFEMTHAVGEVTIQASALAEIAIIERDLGDLAQARSRIEAAIDLVESQRAGARSEDLRAALLASKYSNYEFYTDLLMRMHERQPTAGFDLEAFEVSERTRARNLLEILTATRGEIRLGVASSLLDRQRLLQQQINAKERSRMQMAIRRQTEKAAALEKEVSSLLTEYRELQDQIRVRSPRYAALTAPAPLKLKEVQQRMLDRDTLLLEYALGEDRSFVWAVTATSLRVFTLPGRAVIEAAAQLAYQRLIKSNQREYAVSARQAASELSRMVLGPVAAELGRKRLVIVGDGALQYLPFGALPAPVLGGAIDRQKPLIVDHEVISLPSASILMETRREPPPPTLQTVAVISDPVFDPNDPRVKPAKMVGATAVRDSFRPESALARSARETDVGSFERLIHTREEAEAIVALAPPKQSLKALDFAASRATVESAGLDQYRI